MREVEASNNVEGWNSWREPRRGYLWQYSLVGAKTPGTLDASVGRTIRGSWRYGVSCLEPKRQAVCATDGKAGEMDLPRPSGVRRSHLAPRYQALNFLHYWILILLYFEHEYTLILLGVSKCVIYFWFYRSQQIKGFKVLEKLWNFRGTLDILCRL